jgi:predicted Rossmann-fold nucleotide-binding protein
MPKWPTNLWVDPDPDETDFKECRDQAVRDVERILSQCDVSRAIAVSGYSKPNPNKVQANWLGAEIAQKKWNLLSGGLGGAMKETMTGFVDQNVSGYKAIAILPKGEQSSVRGTLPVDTGLSGKDGRGQKTHMGPASRNHVLIYCATRVTCLPGAGGSIAEATLAKKYYHRPVIGYCDPQNVNGSDTDWQTKVEKWKRALEDLEIPMATNPQTVLNWL